MNPQQNLYHNPTPNVVVQGLSLEYMQYEPSPETSSSLETPVTPYSEQQQRYGAYMQHVAETRDFEGYYYMQPAPDQTISTIAPQPEFPTDDGKSAAYEADHHEIDESCDEPQSTSGPPRQIGERLDQPGIVDTIRFDEHNMLRSHRPPGGKHKELPSLRLLSRKMELKKQHAPDENDSGGEGSSGSGSETPMATSSFSSNQSPEHPHGPPPSLTLEDTPHRSLEMQNCDPFEQRSPLQPRFPHAFSMPPTTERRQTFTTPVVDEPNWAVSTFSIHPPRTHHREITIPNGPPRMHTKKARKANYPYPSSNYGPPLLPAPSTSPTTATPSQSGHREGSPEHVLTETYIISNEELDRYFTPTGDALLGKGAGGRKNWLCPECRKNVRKQDRASHMLAHGGKKRFECRCGKKFGRPQDADRHLREQAPCLGCHGKMGRYGKNRRCSSCILEIEQGIMAL